MTDNEIPAGVRHAQPADEDAIFKLMMLAHAENGLFSVDEAKTRAMIQRATQRQHAMIGLIDGPTGIEGLICLVIAQYWYTTQLHLEELMNFVHPDHRRTTHAKRLIEYAKYWQRGLTSSDEKIPLIMGIMTHRRLEPKLRLYQRQLPQIGAVFQFGGDAPPDAFNQRRLAPPVKGTH